MKWMKKFETFVTDLNRDTETTDYVPKHNPVLRQVATEFVDSLLKGNDYSKLFKLVGIELPKEIEGSEIDDLFDEVKNKAIEYFIDNPEQIGKEITVNQFQVNSGDGIPRVQSNLGGSSHANSLRIGESKRNFDAEIEISEEDMNSFNSEEPLIELIRNNKVALGNKKIEFNKKDKETIKTLDIYFEFDQSSFESDEEETTE